MTIQRLCFSVTINMTNLTLKHDINHVLTVPKHQLIVNIGSFNQFIIIDNFYFFCLKFNYSVSFEF